MDMIGKQVLKSWYYFSLLLVVMGCQLSQNTNQEEVIAREEKKTQK